MSCCRRTGEVRRRCVQQYEARSTSIVGLMIQEPIRPKKMSILSNQTSGLLDLLHEHLVDQALMRLCAQMLFSAVFASADKSFKPIKAIFACRALVGQNLTPPSHHASVCRLPSAPAESQPENITPLSRDTTLPFVNKPPNTQPYWLVYLPR